MRGERGALITKVNHVVAWYLLDLHVHQLMPILGTKSSRFVRQLDQIYNCRWIFSHQKHAGRRYSNSCGMRFVWLVIKATNESVVATRKVAGVVSQLTWATIESVAVAVAFQLVRLLLCVLSNRTVSVLSWLVPLSYVLPLPILASDANFDGALDDPNDDRAISNLTSANHRLQSRY